MGSIDSIFNEGKELLNRGIANDDIDSINSSILKFDKVIENHPDYSLAYSLRAKANCELGNFYSTINDYRKLVILNPNSFEVYSALASTELFVGKNNDALNNINMAINLNSDDYLNYFIRGNINKKLINPLEAIFDFEKSLKLNNENIKIIELSMENITSSKKLLSDVISGIDKLYSKSSGFFNGANLN